MAVFLVASMAGLSVTPTAAAVDPDCNEDFEIADSEATASTRTLNAGQSETGEEDVLALTGDEVLTVELLSPDDVLEFGIFEDVDGCMRSSHVSPNDCKSDFVLDTTNMDPDDDAKECTLRAPGSGSRTFFVVFENIEVNGDALDYRAWAS